MKNSLTLIFLLFSTLMFAQTQQGYVKTKGRMVNGQLVTGQGLKGATVSVQGHTTVLVNTDDGGFSFPVNTQQFRLDSVRKKGYQLIDMDVCPRTYSYSGNPLYIVMETPEQQLQDKLIAERKIRRNLQKQLEAKEDEIEDLKAQQMISDEEYRNALQKLYQDQESNEQLISDMAKRYSELDYDQLDEFYRQVSYYIENGELVKADSLLNTRGDVTRQVEEQLQKGKLLSERQEELDRAKAVHEADKDELAKRCYGYYETFAAQHLNDTAAYYLTLRASVDTTNVLWQLEAGDFIQKYLEDFNRSMALYDKALKTSLASNGPNDKLTAAIYQNIGSVYLFMGKFDESLEQYEKARQILRLNFANDETDEFVSLYDNLSNYYFTTGNVAAAKDYSLKEIEILKKLHGDDCIELSTSYMNLSMIYDDWSVFDTAMIYAEKSYQIEKTINGEESAEMPVVLFNLGLIYKHYASLEDDEYYLTKAEQCYMEALRLAKIHYGEVNSTLANLYHSISALYDYVEDYDKAIEYALKDIEVTKRIYGERHLSLGESYNGIGITYSYMGDYEKAAEYYHKSLAIMEPYLEHEQSSNYSIYANLGSLYHYQQEYDSAIYYYTNFLDAYKRIYGQHSDMAFIYAKMSMVYLDQEKYPEAIDCMEQAIAVENGLGGNNKMNLCLFHCNLGVMYDRTKQYEKSLPHMEQNLQLSLQLYGEDSADVAKARENLANVLYHQGNAEMSLPYYNAALSTFTTLYGENDSHTVKLREHIKKVEEAIK